MVSFPTALYGFEKGRFIFGHSANAIRYPMLITIIIAKQENKEIFVLAHKAIIHYRFVIILSAIVFLK
jgi:hypothetical protein